jgi:hypothetical protein
MEDNTDAIHLRPTRSGGRCDKHLFTGCDCGSRRGGSARATGGRSSDLFEVLDAITGLAIWYCHNPLRGPSVPVFDGKPPPKFAWKQKPITAPSLARRVAFTTEETKLIANIPPVQPPLVEREYPIHHPRMQWLRDARLANGLTEPYPPIKSRPFWRYREEIEAMSVKVCKSTWLPAKEYKPRHKQFRYPRLVTWVEPDWPDFPAQYFTPSLDSVQLHLARLSAGFDEEDAPEPLEWRIYSRRAPKSMPDAMDPLPLGDHPVPPSNQLLRGAPSDQEVDRWMTEADRKAQMHPEVKRSRGRPRKEGIRTPSGQLSRAKAAGDLGTTEVQKRRLRLVSCPDCREQIADPALAADNAAGVLLAHGIIDDAQYDGALEYQKTRAIALSRGSVSDRKYAYHSREYAAILAGWTLEQRREVHTLVVDNQLPEWAARYITGAKTREATERTLLDLCDGLEALTRPSGAPPTLEEAPSRLPMPDRRIYGVRDALIDD